MPGVPFSRNANCKRCTVTRRAVLCKPHTNARVTGHDPREHGRCQRPLGCEHEHLGGGVAHRRHVPARWVRFPVCFFDNSATKQTDSAPDQTDRVRQHSSVRLHPSRRSCTLKPNSPNTQACPLLMSSRPSSSPTHHVHFLHTNVIHTTLPTHRPALCRRDQSRRRTPRRRLRLRAAAWRVSALPPTSSLT